MSVREATVRSPLEQEAERWLEPYANARHLLRTRDWAVELDPEASEALRLAALLHDIERMVPGGPVFDPLTTAPDDEEYNRLHSERSARLVGEWLRDQGADAGLVASVEDLIRQHEWGGTPEADVLQAADSLAFLEVNGGLMLRWLREGRADVREVRAKHTWTLERIRVARARELAQPLFEEAMAQVDEEAERL